MHARTLWFDPLMAQRGHVALLGDSIFDNSAYTQGAPDVVTHLRHLLPAAWQATLCAVDGATTASLEAQLARVPADASHVVIAIGGNDVLQNIDLLSLRVTSSAEAFEICAERIAAFERGYRRAIAKAVALERHTAVCTVYNGALQDEATIARVALALFNDVILRTAIDLRLDAVELRSICTEPADYANPIEPSGRGGQKIARAIGHLVGATSDAVRPPARIWGQC
jgi:lysophospholipase L1-like esterase